MQDNKTLTTGLAEVSVKEIIALEKSVTDKDQTIGALREQIKNLTTTINEIKADAIAKQATVLIQKGTTKKGEARCVSCGWYYNNTGRNTCPNCGITFPSDSTTEYRNLDSVIEDIRKEEIVKLNLDFLASENKINDLILEKIKLENDLTFKLREVKANLKEEQKDREDVIAKAKEGIRKHMGGIIDEQVKELDDLKVEYKKLKTNKTDEQTEEARKQEIIDLKERITELENITENPLGLGWFKKAIYNWLKVDVEVEIQARRDDNAKKARVDEISNKYPETKNWWSTLFLNNYGHRHTKW